jgi:hypothetical protein
MLMEPASKVSVPLTVVIRTWSNVADVAFDPLNKHPEFATSTLLDVPKQDQVFVAESIKAI